MNNIKNLVDNIVEVNLNTETKIDRLKRELFGKEITRRRVNKKKKKSKKNK